MALGIKTVLEGNTVKLIKNNGDEVARISNSTMHVSKHGIKAADGSVAFKSADEVNAEILGLHPTWDSPYDSEMPIADFITLENNQFVRVFKQGTNNPQGEFIVKVSEIEGLTPLQIKDKLALDHIPDKILDVNIPSNFPLRTGKIAPRPNGTTGGLTQFQLLETLDASNFVNIRDL